MLALGIWCSDFIVVADAIRTNVIWMQMLWFSLDYWGKTVVINIALMTNGHFQVDLCIEKMILELIT